MPSSVTDRPTKSHEYLFLLAKAERYYYDAQSIAELITSPSSLARNRSTPRAFGKSGEHNFDRNDRGRFAAIETQAGRNKRSVWTIPTSPFSGAHFAVMPPKLVEPCILAGSSPRACPTCRAPWQRVTEKEYRQGKTSGKGNRAILGDVSKKSVFVTGLEPVTYTTGWRPTCSCPNNDGSGKCLVLDPFAGAGTTLMVALKHGRDYLGIELSSEYVTMAEKRILHVQQDLWTTHGEETV